MRMQGINTKPMLNPHRPKLPRFQPLLVPRKPIQLGTTQHASTG